MKKILLITAIIWVWYYMFWTNSSNKVHHIKQQINNELSTNFVAKDNILNKYNWNYNWNTVISNFWQAKSLLYKIYNKDLWNEFRKTIYCGCKFNWKQVDKLSCWLSTKWYKTRSERIEREHVVPAENFGRAFKSWREWNKNCKYYSKTKWKYITYKGRKCAEKVSPLFNLMEADLYNLFPADGALNAYRSNYQIAEIPWEQRKFGKCDFEISNRKVEPPQDKKGDIARVYMYMQTVYWKNKWLKIISEKNRKLIEAWNKMDPIDKQECIVYFTKKKYQKNINPILDKTCQKMINK